MTGGVYMFGNKQQYNINEKYLYTANLVNNNLQEIRQSWADY